jgi:hypothetical protein
MRDSVRIWLLLSLLAAHYSAQAQIYMCKDASGRTFTADRPIAECAGRTLREFDRKGLARREIPPPPTAEQKRELQAQEEKRRQEEFAADEQRRSDRAMRFRYRSEGEIEIARKRAVEAVQDQIRRETVVLAAVEKRRQGTQAEADSYRKKNEPVPGDLQRALNDADRGVRESKKVVADHEAEIASINAKHDATLKRYRAITGVASASATQ